MPTLGQRLREEREKRGLSIPQLASRTRINAQYLEAIENDDIGALPGGFFYRSFVRQYARLMELPQSAYQAELDGSLEAEAASMAGKSTALPQRNLNLPPMPTGRVDAALEARRWLLRLGVLVLVLAACSGLYALWQRWRVQREQASLAPAPVAAQTEAVPAPAPEPPRPPEPTAEAAAPAGAVQLIVRAKELTWVGVWQGDRQLFADLIHAGESRGFGSPDRLTLRLGNAGGVEIIWNGKTIPPTGPKGQLRMVVFRSDGYSVVWPEQQQQQPRQ